MTGTREKILHDSLAMSSIDVKALCFDGTLLVARAEANEASLLLGGHVALWSLR